MKKLLSNTLLNDFWLVNGYINLINKQIGIYYITFMWALIIKDNSYSANNSIIKFYNQKNKYKIFLQQNICISWTSHNIPTIMILLDSMNIAKNQSNF